MTSIVSPTEPTLFRPDDIQARLGPGPWRLDLFHDGRNDVALVCDAPLAKDEAAPLQIYSGEFWFVLKGEYECSIGSRPPFRAEKGDIVMCPAGLTGECRPAGDEDALRVSVSTIGGDTASVEHQEPDGPGIRAEPPNMLLTRTSDLLANSDQRRFTIIENAVNTVYLIRVPPGDVSKAHWHFDFDEWWVIGGGELVFEVGEGRPKLQAGPGDIVFTPRGFRHQITTVGQVESLRLPVTNPGNVHIWTDDDTGAPPPRA